MRFSKILLICLTALGLVALVACGGSGTSAPAASTATTPAPVTGGGFALAGAAVKGPYLSGDVDIYSVATNGSRALIQSFPGAVGTNGNFNITLSQAPTGIIEVVVNNGSYVDEVTGLTVTNVPPMRTLLDTASAEFNNTIVNGRAAVTPLTTFASRIATAPGTTVDAYAVANSRQMIEQQFGLQRSINTTIPIVSNPSATADPYAVQAGLVVAAIAQIAQSMGAANANTLMVALDDDIEDGVFDGISQGVAVTFNGGTLPANTGTIIYMQSLQTIGTSATFSGYPSASALLATINQAIFSGPATPGFVQNQLSLSASGSVINVMDSSGTEKLVVATGTALSFFDITIDIYGNHILGAARTVTVQDGADGVTGIPTTGQVMAFGYGAGTSGSATVTFVDAYTESIVSTLDTYVTASVNFSGATASISGAVFDGVNGVWLSTADGMLHINLSSMAIDKRYYAVSTLPAASTASPVYFAENFGFDARNQKMFIPFYRGSTPSFPGIQVVDLMQFDAYAANTGVYNMESAFFTSLNGMGAVPDGGAIDFYSQSAISFDEWTSIGTIYDLSSIAIDSYGNFTLPTSGYSQVDFTTGSNLPGNLTGGVIESISHSVLMIHAFGTQTAVGKLDPVLPQLSDWVTWDMRSINSAWMMNSQDPHGVVVTTMANGKVIGLMSDSSRAQVAIVDIDALMAAPRAMPHQLDLTQLPANAIRFY